MPTEEKVVDERIAKFNEWFQAQGADSGKGNDPLVGSEKAIIKTFLWWEAHAEKAGASTEA